METNRSQRAASEVLTFECEIFAQNFVQVVTDGEVLSTHKHCLEYFLKIMTNGATRNELLFQSIPDTFGLCIIIT